MNEEYFEWLLNKAGVDDGDHGYSILCSVMHEMIFYPILEMDADRWEDGVRYRYEFAFWHENQDERAADILTEQLDDQLGGCTMLELVISLIDKMSFEMLDSQYEAGPGKWFEELIGNLGLDVYTNKEFMENEAAYFEVDQTLERVIFRKYNYNGEGGFFPLRRAEDDQRSTELIIQMNNYLAENYDILG